MYRNPFDLPRFVFATFVYCLLSTLSAFAITGAGGNVTNLVDGFRYHTFTNNGTFSVDSGGVGGLLIVAGGGGGGGDGGGGGGAGGLVYISATNLPLGVYDVTVGGGGAGGPSSYGQGADGGSSSFGPHVAAGGGGGSGRENNGRAGGSGGGGGASNSLRLGGEATPAGQGHAGGTNSGIGNPWPAAGGGGAGSVGSNAISGVAGRGGEGLYFSQFAASGFGSPVGWFGGGGGGSLYYSGTYGGGGTGGGGTGGAPGAAGIVNTGGGGGASQANASGRPGGSGIVIVRYAVDSILFVDYLPVTQLGSTNAVLNGELISDGGDDNTRVAFCWGAADAGEGATNDWPNVVSLGGGWQKSDSFSHPLYGLHAGSAYVYRVYATNTVGEDWSDPVVFHTFSQPNVETRGATRIGRSSAILHGEVTDPGHPDLNPGCGFLIWVPGAAVTSTVPAGAQGGVFSVAADGLEPATGYEFMAFASNAAGTAWSTTGGFKTPPAGPLHLYVATNGNNTAGTNWTAAFTQPQTALDLAEPGDILCLAGHTFTLDAPIAWPVLADLTLAGGYAATDNADLPGAYDALRWPTVITRNPAVNIRLLSINAATNPVVERVTLQGGYTTTASGGGIHAVDAVNFILRDCRILDNTANPGNALAYGGGVYAVNCSGLISNVLIRGNAISSGSQWATGAGVYLEGGGVTLRDMRIVHNQQTGLGTRGVGIGISGGTHLLRNLLVAFNSHGGSSPYLEGGGLYIAGGATVTMENLTVAGHGLQGLRNTSANVTLRNSIFYQNVLGSIGGTTPALANNSLDTDPKFEAPLFYLRNDSPCIDAGDRSVEAAGLAGLTTQTNGLPDTGMVDLGYHFEDGTAVDRVLYVSPAGNDDNDGSGPGPGQALRSITRALTLSSDARQTRIHLAAGNYANGVETFPLTIDERAVRIVGTNALTTVIDASGANQRILNVSNSLGDNGIEAVTIRGGNVSGDHGGGLRVERSAFSLRDCRVIDNAAYMATGCRGGGLYAIWSSGLIEDTVFLINRSVANSSSWGQGGAMYLLGGTWQVRHSIMAANRGDGGGSGGGAAFINDGSHVFHNILVANNSAWGTFGGSHVFEGGGFRITGQSAVQIENATVAGNTPPAIRNNSAASGVVIRNSIFYNNTRDFEGTTPSLTNNCISDGTSAGVNGNFSADPRFELPLFYLMNDSPCIDAGDRTAEVAGLAGRTTRTDGSPDAGTVNLGYHYAAGLGIDLELFVSPSGNDANDGAGPGPAQALRSITRALSLSAKAPRARIHVAAGVYDNAVETFPLVIDGRTAQILGASAALTTIDAAGSGHRVFTLTDSFGDNRIEGLTIRGGNVNPDDGGGLHVANSLLTLRDCIVRDNYAYRSSNSGGGGLYAWLSGGIIRDCVFMANTVGGAAGSWAYGGGALWLHHGSWTVRESVFVNNGVVAGGCRGGAIYAIGGDHEVRGSLIVSNYFTSDYPASQIGNAINLQRHSHVPASTRLRVESCTLSANTSSGSGAIHADGDMQVYNTIIYGNSPADVVALPVAAFWHSCSPGLTAGVQGNITDDPLFMGNGDYTLQLAYSPCIDAGTNRAWMVNTLDLQGFPRISKGRMSGPRRVDIGAYEGPPAGSMIKFR